MQEFIQHVAQHGHSYGTIEEFNFRFGIFAQKHAEIMTLNADPNMTSTVGHNFLSTWTDSEKKRLLGYSGLGERNEEFVEETNAAEVDWRTKNVVNAVTDQQQCGSCWAFSATAAVESEHAIKTGKLVKLSEEQLVQCSTRNNGCGGGSMALAFQYLEQHDQNTETNYPYSSGRGQTGTCNHSLETGTIGTTGYTNVPRNNPSQLKSAIAKGVVSVAIEADKTVFQHYTSGVITSASCGTNLDHGVAAVGYGTENGQDYFLVRNSWGPSWGDKGYVKIGMASGAGVCGINSDAVWPEAN